jgi:hypothetical protein
MDSKCFIVLAKLVLLSTLLLSATAGRAEPFKTLQTEAGTQADLQCLADFNYMVQSVKLNYSGYRDKVQGKEGELAKLTGNLSEAAKQAEDLKACTDVLNQWLKFFHDGHLFLTIKPSPSSNTPGSATTPDNDPNQPSLTFLDQTTALLRLPAFGIEYKQTLDRLLEESKAKLGVLPTLIIDLRGNRGGLDMTYDKLIPLLYTNPIKVTGADLWSSADNIRAYKSFLDDKNLPEDSKKFLRELITRMEQAPGTFVKLIDNSVDKREKVLPFPREVAILMDESCVSSAEQFILAARESKKVILFGTNTGGVLDYSNTVPREMPSGKRLVFVPVSRSKRVSENRPIDGKGIPPDIRIPADVRDWVAFVRGYFQPRIAKPKVQ